MPLFADRRRSPRDRNRDIEVELTKMVFHNILIIMVLAMIAVAGTTSILAHLYRDKILWGFNAVMTLISLARIVAILAFHRLASGPLTVRLARRWLKLWSALTLTSFTATGAFTLYNFSQRRATAEIFSAVGLFILCAGMSGRLSGQPRVEQTAGLISLGALFWGIANTGEPYAWVVCLMLILFFYGHCTAVENRFELTVEQLHSRRKLRTLAHHDALTGLPNRRNFEDALSSLCQQDTSFAVLYLDLDGFKKVNDNFGHAIGDSLLEQVAQRLQLILRESDLVARLGGDEFAILHAPGASRTTAATLAQLTIDAISAPYVIDDHQLSVGTSVGIQLSRAEGANDPDKLLSEADKALYAVKQTGKGTFRFAAAHEAPEELREADRLKRLRPQPLYD